MVRIELRILLILWLAFYAYWLVSAKSAKRNVRSNRRFAVYRILFLIVFFTLLLGLPGFRRFVTVIPRPAFVFCGLIVCALGLSLAVWARRHIGTNWGMPMSIKQNPELVTTGPYRYIRHPIYSGILLGMLGSALAAGIIWLIIFAFFGSYFVVSARAEERLMLQQFPEQYPQYQARTKAMIPFIW